MYTFAEFDTVQALPDVMTAKDFAKASGLSASRTYEFLDEAKIPYLKLNKRKIIFKEHLLQGLSGSKKFTDISKLGSIAVLPGAFPPSRLVDALGIIKRCLTLPELRKQTSTPYVTHSQQGASSKAWTF